MYHRDLWFIIAGLTSVWLATQGTWADTPKAEPGRRPRGVWKLAGAAAIGAVLLALLGWGLVAMRRGPKEMEGMNTPAPVRKIPTDTVQARVANEEAGKQAARLSDPERPTPAYSAPERDPAASRQLSPTLVPELGHSQGVTAVALSGDGKWLASGSSDDTIHLWEVATGEEVRVFRGRANRRGISSLCLSDDGKWLASGYPALVWEVATGKQVLAFPDGNDLLFLSLDGKWLATTGMDQVVRLWEVATGKEVRAIRGYSDPVHSASLSRDGKWLVTRHDNSVRSFDTTTFKEIFHYKNTVRLWEVATGKEVRVISWGEEVWSVALSGDGRWLVTGGRDIARLWEVATGKVVRDFRGHSGAIHSVSLSRSGSLLASGSFDGTVRLWEVATGKEIRAIQSAGVNSLSLSGDGKWLAIGNGGSIPDSADADVTPRLWEVATGKEKHPFRGNRSAPITSASVSSDGKWLFTCSGDVCVSLWETATGKEVRGFRHSSRITAVTLSGDDKWLVTGCEDSTAHLWDTATGKEGHVLRGSSEGSDRQDKTLRIEGQEFLLLRAPSTPVKSVSLSGDGKLLATGCGDMARLWDTATGKEVHNLHAGTMMRPLPLPAEVKNLFPADDPRISGAPQSRGVDFVSLSGDGKWLATSSGDTVRLWEVATGKEIRSFRECARCAVFSRDGNWLVTGTYSDRENARLWEVATGKAVRTFSGHTKTVSSVCLSGDGRWLVTGSEDATARLWELATGKEVGVFRGHSHEVTSVALSADGKFLVTGSKDYTTRLWNVASGRELCQLISFRDGTWAVVDPDGRFDAARGGDVDGLHWVVGMEPIALSQLKARYYEPGLLAKKLDFNKEPLRRVDAFRDPKLYPEVQLTEPTKDNPRLGITLTNRGGGIGRVVILLNGKEITADARGPKVDANADKLQLEVDLANDPRLIPGQKNVIEVYAYNAEGYLRSRGLDLVYTPQGRANTTPPELWLVVAGVSDYRGDLLDLRYAAKDADDFASAARIAGERLFGADKVHLHLLTTTQKGDEHQPSRANLAAALKAAQKAKPGDVLVVYLAGHGINYGGQDGDFYFLCCDAADANLTDSEVRKQVALSSNELTELLKVNPAKKQVLVLDTCASGKLIDKLTEKRDVPSSQIRALEMVKDRTGMYILAGCASNAVSYEATRFAQGVLTYSLLLGMRGAALKEDRVEVGRLFEFAADKVPELARDIGGIQKPMIASPRGGQPFPIGRLTPEDQARIPLQAVRPLVLRCSLQDEIRVRDHLGLSKRVNERLREASASGRSAKLVFVEAEEFPDAYVLVGRYRLAGDTVKVTLSLFRADEAVAQFIIDGSKTDLDALAGKIVRAAEQKMEGKPGNSRK